MNSSAQASVITELNDVASVERQSNVDRTLRMVAGGYGKITAGMISRRQAWGVQTVLRYLNGLEEAGRIEHVGARRTVESAWRITSAGKEYLQNVTNGCWATTVKSQSPGSTEREHHGN